MIILRNKFFSDDTYQTMLDSANEVLGKDEEFGKEILGTLVIDRYIDRSRYIGKSCVFKVNSDFNVLGNWEMRGNTYWKLSDKFEPLDNFPQGEFKKFIISGLPKNNDTLDANIIMKSGKVISGRVKVEVR